MATLQELHQNLLEQDPDYREAPEELQREYLEFLQQAKALPDRREVPAPLFSSDDVEAPQQRHVPAPAISGGIKRSAPPTEEEPLFKKEVVGPESEINRESREKFRSIPYSENSNEQNRAPQVISPDAQGVLHVSPAPRAENYVVSPESRADAVASDPLFSKADDGALFPKSSDGTVQRAADDGRAQPQPQVSAPAQAVEPQPERSPLFGPMLPAGLDQRTPVQEPEPKAATVPEPLFSKQSEEQQTVPVSKPATMSPRVNEETQVTKQGRESNQRIDEINKLNRSLEMLFAGSQRSAQGGLPQAQILSTPRRRSDEVEQLLSHLSPHSADVLRSLDLTDDQIKSMLQKIVGVRQAVKNVQHTVRQQS